MHSEPAEAAPEGQVLLRAEVMFVEKDDQIFEEGLTDLGDRSVVERLCQIDTQDFSAEPPAMGRTSNRP